MAPIDPAGAQAAAGEHGAEGGGLVAAAAAGVELGGAAELGGDHDQGRVEPADALQVVDQGREGVVELGDQLVLLELALVVGVPAGAVEEVQVVRDLDEPDARLDQPPGQQAALAELAAVRRRGGRRLAVELEDPRERRAAESRAASRLAAT